MDTAPAELAEITERHEARISTGATFEINSDGDRWIAVKRSSEVALLFQRESA
jgi:hypothetical protein